MQTPDFKNPPKSRFKFKAFSLIELSFVILIIGVLVAGIVLGKNLIGRSRITNAQTLAQSSPVLAISDLQLWLENSLDRSFKANEMVDGNSLSMWNNISPSSKVGVVAVGSGPVYSTVYTINSIPGVRFTNSAVNYLTISNASFLNNTDYTICVTEKRESSGANNYFIGDTTVTASNQNLLLGYLADGMVIHSQAGTTVVANSNVYSSSVVGYAASSNPKLFCFVQNSATGKSTYINGMLAGTIQILVN
ncbi:MAG: prepilin-type N-terminal cleavage/methylation domain-containing protein [Alphaproteobacteria bacterium]|nr:prepilin-type N-terminal cleavage/methylation domain-containing protein [Alphaproteobacteria bacterium]